MTKSASQRLTWFILGFGVAITAAVYAVYGRAAGQSSAIGVAVALGNWYALRFIIGRVMEGSLRRKAVFSVLLSVKMGALLALCFLLIRTGLVRPVAFTAGLSALVVGALLGSFAHALFPTPTPSES
ncbi:MAG: hypothetical protein ACHQ53_12945 [Polyangiales bacterium]